MLHAFSRPFTQCAAERTSHHHRHRTAALDHCVRRELDGDSDLHRAGDMNGSIQQNVELIQNYFSLKPYTYIYYMSTNAYISVYTLVHEYVYIYIHRYVCM